MTDKTTERLKETAASAIRERDQLKAENDKLRNEVGNLMDFEHLTSVAVAYAGCDECGEYKQTMLRLFAENDKLRELAVRAYKAARMMCEAWDGPCQNNSDVLSWGVPCPADERDEQCVFGQLERDMRELGIEVE